MQANARNFLFSSNISTVPAPPIRSNSNFNVTIELFQGIDCRCVTTDMLMSGKASIPDKPGCMPQSSYDRLKNNDNLLDTNCGNVIERCVEILYRNSDSHYGLNKEEHKMSAFGYISHKVI
uniref:Uncharacterized protein n=1 Tax=Glossina austeni TaxID=7395 RepID=A0A1A9V601_GLOAU